MIYNRAELEGRLKNVLSEYRYRHTVGVTCTTIPLAMNFGCDVNHAEIAGVLHDCAKAFSEEEQLKMCRENNIELSKAEENNGKLLHAKLGAFLAKTEYGIEDEDILNAIRYHTTGRPDMTLIEKIVFVADFIEPGRTMIFSENSNFFKPTLEEIRKIAYTDIDDAVFYILRNTLMYLYTTAPFTIDGTTKSAFDYYRDLFHKRHDREEIQE